jgi:hypothetical protein
MSATRWCYILVFDDALGTRKEIQNFLNTRPEVLNWYACMSNAIFIVSDQTASGLQRAISTFNQGKDANFIILDVKTDRNGWLPKTAWEFLSNPKATWER